MDNEKVSFKPRGYRDVYWCWMQGEPFFADFKNDDTICPYCERVFKEDNLHIFICSIKKPVWHHSWEKEKYWDELPDEVNKAIVRSYPRYNLKQIYEEMGTN